MKNLVTSIAVLAVFLMASDFAVSASRHGDILRHAQGRDFEGCGVAI